MLQGSKHQGDSCFKANGRQCVANSLSAIILSYKKPPCEWDRDSMDSILDSGDKLYCDITYETNTVYLSLEDIPNKISSVSVFKGNPLHGTIMRNVSDEPFYSLTDVLTKLCSVSDDHACFLFTMGNTYPAYTNAIIKTGDSFYFFDPHSRSETGMSVADGYATMTSHSSVENLCMFIKHLAANTKPSGQSDTPFEMIHILCDDDGDVESNFSGFSTESEGELTCRLYLAKQSSFDSDTDLSLSDVSSISDSDTSDISLLTSSLINDTIDKMNDSSVLIKSIDVSTFDQCHDDDSENDAEDDNEENLIDNVVFNENGSCIVNDKEIGSCDDDSSDDDENIPLIQLTRKMRNTFSEQIQRNDTDDVENGSVANEEEGNGKGGSDDRNNHDDDDLENAVRRGRGRKRIRMTSNWKRNVMKQRRNTGQSYVSRSGKVREARMMKKGCGASCRYKCQANFPEKERQKLFHGFWQLADVTKQRNFITKYAVHKIKKSKTVKRSRRANSVLWTLPKQMEHGSSYAQKVCKTFFIETLAITPRFVSTAQMKQTHMGVCEEDYRGCHTSRPNKTTEDQHNEVCSHIESFKPVDSHYCRKDSTKQYLPSDLSVAKMHSLYKEICLSQSISPVGLPIYRRIFNSEYNLSFHKPLKDQCDLCSSYKNADTNEKEQMECKYLNHIKNKNVVNKLKLNDKERASLPGTSVCAACFDLEQILLTPHSFESSLYYKRRLSTFNFTIYDLGTKDGHCFTWNESIAKRGGSEIASCVQSFIAEKSKAGIKDFVFFSDNCQGQNKNRFYLTMLWHSLHKYDLNSITHRYLEKGHTFNENDSIHSAIENASRNIKIFTTSQWAAVIRVARRSNPYKVKEMSSGDFYDFKIMSENLKNFEYNFENEKMYWANVRSFHLSQALGHVIQYQTDHDGPFMQVDLLKRARSKINPKNLKLVPLRKEAIPISREKYFDLISLCGKNIIPRVHHGFYLFLTHD